MADLTFKKKAVKQTVEKKKVVVEVAFFFSDGKRAAFDKEVVCETEHMQLRE